MKHCSACRTTFQPSVDTDRSNASCHQKKRPFFPFVAITHAKTNTTIYYLKYNPSVFILEITNETEDDVFKKCPFCGYGHLRIAKEGWTTTGDYYVSVGCSNFALASCDYYQTFFYKQEPTKEQVERLVLANPNNPDNQVTVDRPLTPQRPPAPNPTNPSAEPAQPQPRPRVGYVDTNQIQPKPKRQWPTEYPDGMPSWFKNKDN